MGSTLTGISTIRACKANERLALEFDNLQNVHSSVWQTLMSINTGECRKAINDELGREMMESTSREEVFTINVRFLSSTSHFHVYVQTGSLDYSTGTLARLCVVLFRRFGMLQLHRDESAI